MKSLQFFGASGTVTGSSYLLTMDTNQTLLIDLGLFQGEDDKEEINAQPLPFDAKNLSAVFVTHAHLDHCGRLPLLIQNGFSGPIYTTAPTKDIIKLSLLDTIRISQEEKKEPLYTKDDVEKLYKRMQEVFYDMPFHVGDATVTFRNAGHILGSASIEISDTQKTVVFSGDLGNSPQDIIEPTEYSTKADTVIMESTYGNTIHPKEDVSDILRQEITAIEHGGGTLLIPAFSIERTQEILHRIHDLKNAKKIAEVTPVFLDSPMAIEVTDIFNTYHQFYNATVGAEHAPFDFPNLIKTPSSEESKNIVTNESPKVIIAGSGKIGRAHV